MLLPNFSRLLKSVGILAGMTLIFGSSLVIISPAPAQAACASLPSDKGQATFSVSIPTTGIYRVWTRLYPASIGNGQVQMQVDQTYCNVVVGQNSTLPANQFTWVDYGTTTSKINLSLSAGSHVITLAGVDPAVGVDKIMFVTDTTCVPTGFGTNCSPVATATPVPVGQTTPQPTSSSHRPTASAPPPAATPVPGTTQIVIKPGNSTTPVVVSGKITLTPSVPTSSPATYLVDNQSIAGNSLDTSKLTDGYHVIEQITTDSKGKPITAKQTIKVENGWQYQLVRGVQGNWRVISGIILLLIALGGGIIYLLAHRVLRPVAKSDIPSEAVVIMPSDPNPILPIFPPEPSEPSVPADSNPPT